MEKNEEKMTPVAWLVLAVMGAISTVVHAVVMVVAAPIAIILFIPLMIREVILTLNGTRRREQERDGHFNILLHYSDGDVAARLLAARSLSAYPSTKTTTNLTLAFHDEDAGGANRGDPHPQLPLHSRCRDPHYGRRDGLSLPAPPAL